MAKDQLNDISYLLGGIDKRLENIETDLAEVKSDVGGYKKDKNKLIGFCIGVSAAAGTATASIAKLLGFHI